MNVPFANALHRTGNSSSGLSAAPSAAACSPAAVASTQDSSGPIVRGLSASIGLLLFAKTTRNFVGALGSVLASAIAAAMLLVLLVAGCSTV
jgi:hypothetical protein